MSVDMVVILQSALRQLALQVPQCGLVYTSNCGHAKLPLVIEIATSFTICPGRDA
jgi:hypothetical protein